MPGTQPSNGNLILVTGAGGLIGVAVVSHLLDNGYRVRAMVHRTSPFALHPNLEVVHGDITDETCVQKVVESVHAIIHLAARKSDERDSMEVNEGGARILAKAAARAGVSRIMNISTQSVKLPTHGLYARSKEAADTILEAGEIPTTSLRFSVVYGEREDGIIGMLLKFAKLPVVPVIGNGRASFAPIHRNDAARSIVNLMEKPDAAEKTYDAGGPELWTFDELLHECGRRIGKPNLWLFHIPIPIAMLIAKMGSILKRPPITVSNVLGAAAVVPIDTRMFFRDIGFTPRAFSEGIAALFPEEEQKKNTDESIALLRYVLPDAPNTFPESETVALYERALKTHNVRCRVLDERVRKSLLLLGGLDAITRIGKPHSPLRQKLLIAAAIAECSPESATALLPKNRSTVSIVLVLVRAGISFTGKFIVGCGLMLLPSFVRRNAGE